MPEEKIFTEESIEKLKQKGMTGVLMLEVRILISKIYDKALNNLDCETIDDFKNQISNFSKNFDILYTEIKKLNQ